ncbi:hybrid sensor histidine kinase/response regulator [Microcoleus sp. FACHB-1515]|uniref:hybrid sensor histidine kinase/response regulator n=1 Tax=Cyanophyceae TaxID=3028117 RepID=UPI0016833980|nr:hybrid sensor histidine kinase/response regulator [Microcoleus sp. FACHB-1515]MBD2092580.1 hybrid sensor histidine kinase/response regulator [Microcoleus sp. FACHB-1515]
MTSNDSNSNGTILIIDDTPDNLRFLSELLTKAGYEVRKVINGELGIESALVEPPDLILLDIRMPGIDGYEVCDRLKHSDRTSSIPVIFLSASSEEFEKVMAFQAGGVDYIIKPFQVVEVLARIETHLRISRLQQQLQRQNSALENEIEQRNSAEAALKILNQGLEARIQERTLALQTENNQLLELQSELQKAIAQEQRRNKLQFRWIRNIAQKFRTPVAVATSAVELLKQENNHRSAESDRYLQIIENSTRTISRSLQDILLLANESQEPSFNPTSINLTQACQSFIDQWQLPSSPEYRLLFVSFGKSPDSVFIDEALLQQICTHLLVNAVCYSPNGGTILFELIYEPTKAIIRVRDEGIGIPLEDQPRIFDRFYRAKNADAIAQDSTGLGLAVVKRAVEQHGGTIAVSSEINRGSIFEVSFPIEAPAEVEQESS